MHFHLKRLVLWPRISSLPPRIVEFVPDAVNVITGVSRTGKSAIIPIVDYCLGADTCAIPVQTVRDSCEWFGIVVRTESREILLARREPGEQRSTNEMFLLEAPEADIPNRISEGNTTADAVKEHLNGVSGLTQLDFDIPGYGTGFGGRPSFRDMTAFVFQPQGLIANPNVLFYKAESQEHREKLRTIFPYVLGAVTPGVLAREHELSTLRQTLRLKERELATLRQVSERWVAEIRAKASIARELGLLRNPPGPSASIQDYVRVLRDVVQQFQQEVAVSPASVTEAARELAGVHEEEATVSSQLVQLKRRYADMTRLRDVADDYGQAMAIKRDRLQIADWMRRLSTDEHTCPICGTPNTSHLLQLDELHRALRETEEQIGEIGRVPAVFDREQERIRTEVERATERLQAIALRRRVLERASDHLRDRQYAATGAARFVGALEEALERYDRLGDGGDLTEEVDELRIRIQELERDLANRDVRGAVDRALRRLTVFIAQILPQLDAERPNDPVRLSISDLTIKVTGRNRDDYLWEIGSGANWVSYHVATILGLHSLFLTAEHSPVPSLLIVDQPSQVYFPKRTARSEDDQIEDVQLSDEDIIAVRRIFIALSRFIAANPTKMQIIVLDHAADDVWGGIEHISLVEEWRDGRTLIPRNWLT